MYRTLVPTVIVLACAVAGAGLDHVPQTRGQATRTTLNPGATTAFTYSLSDTTGAICLWRPAADDHQVTGAVLGVTVRRSDRATLHRVTCADGWIGWLSAASWMGPPERQWHGTTSSGCHRRRCDDRGVDAGGSSGSLSLMPGFCRCR